MKYNVTIHFQSTVDAESEAQAIRQAELAAEQNGFAITCKTEAFCPYNIAVMGNIEVWANSEQTARQAFLDMCQSEGGRIDIAASIQIDDVYML